MVVRPKLLIALLSALCLLGAACTNSDSSETPTTGSAIPTTDGAGGASETPSTSSSAVDNSVASSARLEVALVFTYHQPYLPAIDGALELPSARLSAARHYLDVPQLLEEFPAARASISISAPTISQLKALTNPRGAQRTVDRHYLVASKSPSELTPADQQFILNNFFEGPSESFQTLPRWDELRELRDAGSTLTDPDLRDVAVLFHLAQLDPELVEQDQNLSGLVGKASGFSDADARIVLQAIDNRVDLISSSVSELVAAERLELITSTGVLASSEPVRLAETTTNAFGIAADFSGEAPRGLTVVGDVASDADIAAMAAGGAQWILAADPDDEADVMAPRSVEVRSGSIKIISANSTLADLIKDEYFEVSAADAAEDLLSRLSDMADSRGTLDAGLVTIVIDGQTTWEPYENGGSTFLRTLLNALTTSEDFALTTPSRYMAQYPGQIEPLTSAAALFGTNKSNWQGEPEENSASALITEALLALEFTRADNRVPAEAADLADQYITNAQAADFTYYFGQDQESADDQIYDRGFRTWLAAAYETLELEVPESVLTPIVPPPFVAAKSIANGEVAIKIDGNPSDWARATLFDFANSNDVITDFGVAIDGDSLALRFDGGIESEVQIYMAVPRNDPARLTTISGDALGFGATHLVVWTDGEGACLSEILPPDSVIGTLPPGCVSLASGLSEAGVELKIGSAMLGGLQRGDVISVRIKTGSSLGPIVGPIRAEIPVSSP